MKQVLFRKGRAVTAEVPAPMLEPGTLLVRSGFSCISTGTELSGIQASGDPLWKRALRNPQAVGAVLKMATTQGVSLAASAVRTAVAVGHPAGYSVSGIVEGIGEGVDGVSSGMRVACAGAQCAHHAEWVRVPLNLAVPVPEQVSLEDASTVALGAIALQGVRRASPTLGETFVVVGLGILGQLVCQMLRANGCRVIATDTNDYRRRLAARLGTELILDPSADADVAQVARLTAGVGADGVLITASTPSDDVISTAFRMCRRKGRVVLVGDVGLHLRRADVYEKELDFFVSTSYGPGRYDRRYESEGLDYPIGYVRWTENRNMGEYLRLISDRKIDVGSLVGAVFDVTDADKAYDALRTGEPSERPLVVLLKYPRTNDHGLNRKIEVVASSRARTDRVRLAVVGAGSFASGVHLPNLRRLNSLFALEAIVNRTGHRSTALAEQYGARYASTDLADTLANPDVDAVLIATRHDQHAELTLRALRAGKHVFVEKPLSLEEYELEELESFFTARSEHSDRPFVMTGFNRRFSPHIRFIQKLLSGRSDALLMNYRVNAGYLPSDHWVHGSEGGGRNRGEACHIYDLALAIVGSDIERVSVERLRPRNGHYLAQDNFAVTLGFADGSLANITYTALGSTDAPKEQMEIHSDGRTIRMVEYRETNVFGGKAKGMTTRLIEKGHREGLEAFGMAIRNQGPWPIPWHQQLAVARVSFEVERQLNE